VADIIGFSGLAELSGLALADGIFISKQLLAHHRFATLVKVQAVYPGDNQTQPTMVDVLPIINQVNSVGTQQPHDTIYRIICARHHGGANAVLIDPAVGDVGWMSVGDRDHSKVVANQGQQSAPGSARTMSLSDGMFFGGIFTAAPTNYTDLRDGNHSSITNKSVKHTASGAGSTIVDTATDTGSNRTNTRTNDPANKQIVDTATDGSKQASVIAHADNGAEITATDGTNVATVNAMPNGVVQIIASQGVSMAAGALGQGSAGGGTSALAASNGTTTPPTGAIGEFVTSGLITGVSLSNGVSKTVCSIPLTPGRWDIWGTLYFTSLGGTTNYVLGGLATVLNTYPNNLTGIPYPDMYVENDYVYGDYVASVGRTTLTISASTTFYLNVNVGWTSGSPKGGGILSAIRSG